MPNETATLAEVVGRNARRLREDTSATLENVAFYARECGLKWSSGKVGDLESGRVSPSLPTIYALALALSRMRGEDVTLADLCQVDGNVRINDSLVINGQALTRALRGEPVNPMPDYDLDLWKRTRALQAATEHYNGRKLPNGVAMADVYRAIAQVGQAEQRAAKDLGIEPDHLALLALARWKRTFSEERDRRAGADANAQRRGQVARALKDELRQEISDDKAEA